MVSSTVGMPVRRLPRKGNTNFLLSNIVSKDGVNGPIVKPDIVF